MDKIKKFFENRYGADQLSMVLLVLSLILFIMGQGFKLEILVYFSYLPLIISVYRSFSKDKQKRSMENYKFSILISPIYKKYMVLKRRFNERKTHRFFKCPTCKTLNRVPKGKGKIKITCPNCKTQFEKRT